MAKLSARGRKELARVTKVVFPGEEELTSQRRYTLSLMSDGVILEKIDVVFRSDGKKHSYGWKVRSKVKESVTPEKFVAVFEKKGYARA